MICGQSSSRKVGRGFTLVELLVVITIIGILVGLLLPAVQGVRESARRTQCSNHVYQLARACLGHESAQGFLPTGGWFYRWAGDPNQGFTKIQPGSWLFNILPYMEERPLHDMGKGLGLNPPQYATDSSGSNGKRKALGAIMAATPVQMFVCPSRRKNIAFKYLVVGNWEGTTGWDFYNIDHPQTIARNDYAGNGGDFQDEVCGWGPDPGWGTPPNPYYEGQDIVGYNGWSGPGSPQPFYGGNIGSPHPSNPTKAETGVIYRRSMTQFGELRRGGCFVYLIGEKYLDPAFYARNDPMSLMDETGWCSGFSNDSVRWTGFNCYSVNTAPDQGTRDMAAMAVPRRDSQSEYMTEEQWASAQFFKGDNNQNAFGSPHPSTFNMAMCDGSVHLVSYLIDPEVHRILGNRFDKTPFDSSALR
jgi:prepilin-type N-terminal cleavage/methylation domain-containing protein/prepilin-type processing-associated H-X9-DG protein